MRKHDKMSHENVTAGRKVKARVALDACLRTEGVARFDDFRDGHSRGYPASEVFARIRAHHAEQTNSRR
jgi:hypothetical protein